MNLMTKGTAVAALIVLVFSGVLVLCSGCEVSDAAFELTEDGVKYEILDGNAAVYDHDDDTFPSDGKITISAAVTIDGKEYKVTSIEDGAFSGCEDLVSVTIPENVTAIGDDAFMDCTNLKTVSLPESLVTVGKYAFDSCSSLTSVTMYGSVTTIGEFAFSDCTALTSITIPESVSSIGSDAFFGITFYDTDGTTKITDLSELPGHTYNGSSGKLVRAAESGNGWSLVWILVAIGIVIFIAAIIYVIVVAVRSGWLLS